VINDKTIAYLLKRRAEAVRAAVRQFRLMAESLGYLPDDIEYTERILHAMHNATEEADKKFPLPKGIADTDYDKYKPFMMDSYECAYIGKDGNITDAGMFDLEDD